MCRHKPGPRCHGHAQTSYQSAMRRLEKAREVQAAAAGNDGAPAAARRAEERLHRAAQNAERATLDLDSTASGQKALADALANDTVPRRQRRALQRRQAAGEALRVSRLAQAKLMPPRPAADTTSTRASQEYDRLGKTREQLTYLDAEMAAAPSDQVPALQKRRQLAESDAFGSETNYRVLAAQHQPDTGYLSAEEAQEIANTDADTRRDATYLSHLRATAASGSHPPRFDEHVQARSQQVRTRLFPSTQPSSQAPDVATKQRPSKAWDTAAAAKATFSASGRRRSKRSKVVDAAVDELFDVQSGKHLGKPIDLPGNIS